MKHRLPKLIAHLCIILVLVLLTLLIFDYINPSMDFIDNPGAKIMMAVLSLLSIGEAALILAAYRH